MLPPDKTSEITLRIFVIPAPGLSTILQVKLHLQLVTLVIEISGTALRLVLIFTDFKRKKMQLTSERERFLQL